MLVGYLTAFYKFDCKFSLNVVSTNLNRHAMVFLAAFSILLNFSGCRVIRMADSLQDDDRNGWENSPRWKALDWHGIFKPKSVEKENIHAKAHFPERNLLDSNEDKNLLKPPDPRHLQRYDWWWMTTSTATTPYNFDNIGGGSKIDGFSLFLIVFPLILGIIIIICKYYLCEDRECTFILCKELCDFTPPANPSSSRNSRTRAPLTAFENRSFSAETQSLSGGSSSRPRDSLAARPIRSSTPSVSRGASSASSNTSSVLDKPPGYSDVVMADFSAGSAQFPGVKPTIPPESPPPKYNEEIMKY